MHVRDLDDERKALLVGMGFQNNKKLISLNGYPAVQVTHAGKKSIKYVHRLVAEHYLDVVLQRSTFVHHKDEDRWNFRLSNLHACSHGEHNGLHRRFGQDNHFFGRRHSEASLCAMREAGQRNGPPILDDSARKKISDKAKVRARNDRGEFLPGACA